MSFLSASNPTKLRVGTSGNLEGRNYQVLGRVVLTTADGYRWHEYRLRSNTGEEVTLVYESGDWKFFQLFEPAKPMPVNEAALVRADDMVTLDGRTAAVSYVGRSRVVFVEGAAPEGVKLGDRATYFNADWSGGGQLVVSWTGEEMEFYRGRALRTAVVARGFGLPRENIFLRSAAAFRSMDVDLSQLVVCTLVLLFVFYQIWELIPYRDPVFTEPAPRQVAPAARLPDGAVGQIWAHHYTVTGHALLEIAGPEKKYDRHEYALTDEKGQTALLVQGPDGNPAEWQLLFSGPVAGNLMPYMAASIAPGRATTTEGVSAQVTVFMATLKKADGGSASWPAPVQYGCVMCEPKRWVHLRWTEQAIQVYVGWRVPASEIATAFHAPDILSN